MKQVELLAPAGDQESLIAAIQNGANAIYLGGTLFNARAFAKNFDKEQLLWAVEYAHLRNVRIFVTVNTLYKDDEIKELIDYIDYLYQIQVDALIIQDIGLFNIVRHRYPDFEVHMSTQASVMNKYGVQYFEKRGAKRVVLARENTLEEIKEICASTSLDIEVFVHGALCVGYSGQCLMSSFIGKRSGNRGQCAQPCRLKYRLLKDNQLLEDKYPYLLSPKDLMTINHIGDLIDAGVYSFKIEGRMKRPEYVGSVIRAYRKAIDQHLNYKNESLEDNIYQMKSMFNRDYTQGYIFHDSKIVEGDYSGNKGMIIGKVISYNKKNKRAVVQLESFLKQGDSIVFENIDKGRPVNKIYKNHRLVAQAFKGDVVEIEFDYYVYQGPVRKTINVDVISDIQKTYEKENIKQPIKMIFRGEKGRKAKLVIIFNQLRIERESDVCFEEAKQTPLSKDRIIQQLSKLGQTVFKLEDIEVSLDDNITIPIKELNNLRRNAIDELNNTLSNKIIHKSKIEYLPQFNKENALIHLTHVLVSDYKQLERALMYPIDYIYYPYQSDSLDAFDLCQKHKKEMVLFIPRICKDKDIEQIINSEVYKKVKKIVINDYGSYEAFCGKERIVGTGLNIYNSHSANYYSEDKILSLEISNKQIKKLEANMNHCIVQIYGKVENMISEYCPITQYYFHEQKKNCQICKNHQFALIDRKNEKFDLMMDEQCRMHLLNCKTLYIDHIDSITCKGLLLHFTNETCDEVDRVLKDYYYCLNNHKKSQIKTGDHWTLGYYNI